MNYGYYIDQVFALKHGLNQSEATVYSCLMELPSWASQLTLKGRVYYFASRHKMTEMLPLVTEKPDTMYRHLSNLKKKGLIDLTKHEGKDYIAHFSVVSSQWKNLHHGALGKISESRKNFPDSEKFPNKLGKISENDSEKFPTNTTTSIYPTTRDAAVATATGNEPVAVEDSAAGGPFKKNSAKKSFPEGEVPGTEFMSGEEIISKLNLLKSMKSSPSANESFQEALSNLKVPIASGLIEPVPGVVGEDGLPMYRSTAPTAQEDAEEMITWLTTTPRGKSKWEVIRMGVKAKKDELTDPTETVATAASKLGPGITNVREIFVRKLVGFARTQLKIDREAAASANSKTNGKPYPGRRGPGQRRDVITDDAALASAERVLQRRSGGLEDCGL